MHGQQNIKICAVLCHIEVTRADGKWLAAVVIK